ncbi:MAG: hypothetical protein JW800_04390, partial [Candidatus Omnitrophica bacterium]|nr:hypothetical protein [Candidatus Omnitrophota bacterium]
GDIAKSESEFTVAQTGAITITSSYKTLPQQGDSVAISITGGSIISPTPAPATVKVGDVLTIKAQYPPPANKSFNQWLVSPQGAVSFGALGAGQTTATVVSIAAPITITADFMDDFGMFGDPDVIYDVVVVPGSQSDDVYVTQCGYGKSIAVNAIVRPGEEFVEWSSAGPVEIERRLLTATSVRVYGKGAVRATLRAMPTATLSVTGGWMISPTGTSTVVQVVDTIDIMADIPAGKQFDQWSVLPVGAVSFGSITSAETTATIQSVALPITITAKFKDTPVMYTLTVIHGTDRADRYSVQCGYGESVSISATIKDGEEFTEWKSSGPVVISNANRASTSVKVWGNGMVLAMIQDIPIETYTLEVIGGTSSGQTQITCTAGETVYISASIPSGKEFSEWQATGGVIVTNPLNSYTAVTVNGSGTVEAIFVDIPAPVLYTLTVIPGRDRADMYSVQCGYGETVNISAIVEEGEKFNQWRASGPLEVGDLFSESTSVTVWGDATVVAMISEILPETYTLTIIGGTSSGQTQITCTAGETVYISASIPSGKEFSEWHSVGDVVINSRLSSYTSVTVNGDATVEAIFDEETYQLDVSEQEGYWWSTSCTYGETVSISAWVSSGQEFDYWSSSGDVEVESPYSQSTYVTVRGDGSVEAMFSQTGYGNTVTSR